MLLLELLINAAMDVTRRWGQSGSAWETGNIRLVVRFISLLIRLGRYLHPHSRRIRVLLFVSQSLPLSWSKLHTTKYETIQMYLHLPRP